MFSSHLRCNAVWLSPLAVFSAFIQSASLSSAQVRLNEFMAANDSTIVPGAVAGTFNDWIELYNESAEPADLGGWHLTDNAANLAKWTFPAGTIIPGNGYRIVFASGSGAPDANGNLHTNFSLSAAGEYLALTKPDNSVASEFETGGQPFPPQQENVSYGRKPDDLSSVYFAAPTPGAANAAGGYLPVAAVQASVKRGFYTAPLTVTLSTATAGASIYYTLDSSPPLKADGTAAATAKLYSEPIAISTTTILRSAGVKTSWQSTAVDSQSYIFPNDVAAQTRPSTYPTTWGTGNTGDYAVDPQVSKSAADATRFQAGLRNLPTLSVSTTMANFFGTSGIYTQSTNDALEAVVSAEYFQPAGGSAPVDGVNAVEGFQIDCGMKVQGGSSRNFSSSAKHSFSLRFRGDVGPGKLSYDLFGDGSVTSFNSVQLRAMYNNSWTHSDASQRARATMIPDQWMRDSLLAMGRTDAGHGRFVNLYLNGLFWGVYNLHERVDNDHYAAYTGADPDKAFGYNPGSFSAAEQTSFNAMKSAVTSGNWATIQQRLDVNAYIDYYIMQHFGHNDDLKTDGNWRAAGGGPGNYPWRLYLWDSERVLESPTNVSTLASSQDGVAIIDTIAKQAEFQARFADRAWKYLTNGGALTNARNRARYQARVTELDDAITGESARWGDNRSGGGGPSGDYTRTNNWLPAIFGPLTGSTPTGGVLGATNSWFPETGTTNRTATILAAWKTQRWTGTTVTKLPATDPPVFNVNGTPQFGGVIPENGTLTLTGGTGALYVTTDGSDPRQEGGTVQPGLSAYTAGSAIALTSSGIVRARWFDGTRWSALNEATFYIEPLASATSALRITEIHYNPPGATPQEQLAAAALTPARTFSGDDFQFLEILNNGPAAVNLSGCQLSGGITLTFGNVPLAAGARAVIAEDAAAFAARCGNTTTPAAIWTGALAHSGETVTLLDSTGAPITSVSYHDGKTLGWPNRADGDGSSLELVNPDADPANPASWRSSIIYNGTPGSTGPAADGRILVNEVMGNTVAPLLDSIELVNTTDAPIDLSGWFLSDSKNYRKYQIPANTILAAKAYAVFDTSQFNNPTPHPITAYAGTSGAAPVTVTSAAHGLATGDTITISGYGGFSAFNDSFQITVTGPDTFTIPAALLDNHETRGTWTPGQPFSLDGDKGEDIWLLEGGPGGKLTAFVDHIEFPPAVVGLSLGRWPDADPASALVPMAARTFGAPNSGPPSNLTGYDAWAVEHQLPAAPNPGGGPNDDPDLDGLPNLLEYALGLDPKLPEPTQPPAPVLTTTGDGRQLTLTFQKAAARSDVTLIVQTSPDLITWTTLPDTLVTTNNNLETRTATLPLPAPADGNPGKQFLRLKATR